jgi:FKBP-type peptidyl-prolyl cis-trans isomerase
MSLGLLAAACGSDDREPTTTPTTARTSISGTAASNPSTGNAPGVPVLDGALQRTASGLGYIDEHVGDGATPQGGQMVTVHYTGWLADNGRQFDTSRDKAQPFSFLLGQGRVIKGWDEGVATMKVGGKRRLVIPASLGYGAQGFPPVIPGNATLLFDVELLAIR